VSLRAERKTERIDLGDGEWVDILAELTVKQFCEIAELNEKGFTETALGILSIAIVAWSDPEPVTPEAIAELRSDVADAIATRFQAIRIRSPKASSSPSTDSSKRKDRSRTSTS
jgi:hypothetical protein